MHLEINRVHGHGNVDQEWVRFRATADCDVGNYIVVDNTYFPDGTVSNRLRHSYWFPDFYIAKGDYVLLRTGKGKQETRLMNDGTPLHRFFWGLSMPVWNDSGDAITLIHACNWTFQKVDA